ncbi:MAG: DUF433 domain-containing protein [Candidatus Omnitrophota bacterium]|jgi:uncharacterized protein (DUF433 family)|nr:MAG: DUF433 domain-containing protein [Candidatus Omnitrophota bacterium]
MVNSLSDPIVVTPGRCGGKPHIAGNRIRVQDIVVLTKAGQSPNEIVRSYPHLTLAEIDAALTYYHDHGEDIARQMKEDEEYIVEYQKIHTPIHLESFDQQQ